MSDVVALKKDDDPEGRSTAKPTGVQKKYLQHGLEQAGGKLPLFDEFGQEFRPRTIRACIENGWAEQWFANPIKPDWLVCKLTKEGRRILAKSE